MLAGQLYSILCLTFEAMNPNKTPLPAILHLQFLCLIGLNVKGQTKSQECRWEKLSKLSAQSAAATSNGTRLDSPSVLWRRSDRLPPHVSIPVFFSNSCRAACKVDVSLSSPAADAWSLSASGLWPAAGQGQDPAGGRWTDSERRSEGPPRPGQVRLVSSLTTLLFPSFVSFPAGCICRLVTGASKLFFFSHSPS